MSSAKPSLLTDSTLLAIGAVMEIGCFGDPDRE
jgi:hypothetical protein